MSSDASLTNIRMVKPKGPRIFLGVLVLGAGGAGAWYFTRPAGPVGEPEDPRKILIVGKDADVATTLRELGFQAEHGSFDALAAEGTAQGATGPGIEAILHLADVRGIGHVALQDPNTHPLDGLTITADSQQVTAEHGWAVFTVGDLGMPPRVTVDAEPSELPLPPYIELLRAAFAQQRLANTLFAESQLPMDAVELYHAIKPAVELHGAYAVLDRRVTKDLRERTETLLDGEQAAKKPALLAGPLETSEVLALADGTVLGFVHAWRLESPRDPEVTIQPSTEIELWFHPPGSADPKTRQRCSALRSGTLALGGADLELSAAGDALLLGSEASLELWTLDTKAGACAFTRKGSLPRTAEGEFGSWGAPHASGRVLRPAMALEGLRVDVWSAGAERPQVVPIPGCTEIGDPVWLDDATFAIACAFVPTTPADVDPYFDETLDEDEAAAPAGPPPPPEQSWIYVVRIADGKVVAIPGTRLGEHTGLYRLHAVPRAQGLELLAVHPWGGKLLRIRSEQGIAGLLTEAEATFATLAELDAKAAAEAAVAAEAAMKAAAAGKPLPEPVPAAADPGAPAVPTPLLRPAFVPAGGMVAALGAERLTVDTLEVGVGDFDDLAISPDGTRVVFTTDGGREVRVMPLDGGPATTIAKGSKAVHHDPRFTADGKGVAFTSMFDGNDRAEQIGRLARLE